MSKYLDKTGLTYFFNKLKTIFKKKSEYYLVALNPDGTVDDYTTRLDYTTLEATFTAANAPDQWLDVLWGDSRFYAKLVEIEDVNGGDLKFIGEFEYNGIQRHMVFTLTSQNVLTTTLITTNEIISNKVNDINSNSTSTTLYPTTKAVYDQYQRKPVVVWETSGTGLVAINADMSASPAWQLTNLDMTGFSYVKIYTKAAQKSGATASASTTPSMVLEMSLDSRAAGPYGDHYIGTMVGQKSNDANRLCTLTCAISADKTSFVCLRMSNLYGTGVTDNADVGGYIYKIVGYYD